MVDNIKKSPNYTVVDYKLINSILGLNIKKYLINEKIKKTKENEEYLNNLKNNVEKKYENFTQSLTKYKNKQNLNKNNKEYKEKILSFSKILTQKYNKTFNRYIKQNKRFSFLDKVKKSIKIQSVFRSYIFRIKFFKSMIEKLKNQCIKSIIKIQSFIRQKLSLKHAKIEMINYIILKNYKEKEKKLENVFNTFYNIVKFKDYFLTYDLIKRRYESAKKIQCIFRGNQIYKKVQNVIKKMKTLYTITYPFYAHEVEIKIHVLMNDLIVGKFGELKFSIRTYKFEYNPILKLFILFIEPSELESGKYRCQLIVDNIITCDGRYPHIEFSDGKLYNLINFKIYNKFNFNKIIDDNEQESPSDDIDNTNQSLNNGKNKLDFKKDFDDFSSYEDLKTNLESNVCTNRMEDVKKKSLTELINFD
jgi:hypothetical protein